MPALVSQLSLFSRELRVLLVEDDAATRVLLAAQLRGVFKELILASNGQEGLEAFLARSPDLVLTDNRMPLLSGIAMTEEIRKTDLRVPIIFITSSMDTALLVRAINLGISSIIPKPVLAETLRQAITLVVGFLESDHLQRKNLEQELALLQFREKYHEFQQEVAFRKELSILENDFFCRLFTGEPDAGRGEWLAQVMYRPHDIMCGDSYSLRRLPDGSQLVFLADAMGKGLAAALTTSLSVHTFNLQVDAVDPRVPFSFGAFVKRYTAFMRKRLLEEEVLSLCLAWLPARGALLEVAHFGMPPILVGTPGEPLRKLRCNNPPLSLYEDAFQTTSHDLGEARSILLYTDGLNEASTGDGTLYREHLDEAFQQSACRDQLWKAFQSKVAVPDDDVTFLLLSRVDAVPLRQHSVVVPSRIGQVEQACQYLEDRLEACTSLEAGQRYEFAIALREALLNAYEHGSLGISSQLKQRLLEEGSYSEHLEELEQSQDRAITVDLSVQAQGAQSLLKATVQDEGPGFPVPRAGFDAPDSLMFCGRGLKMVWKYADSVSFNETGNAITLMKFYGGGNHAAGTNDLE